MGVSAVYGALMVVAVVPFQSMFSKKLCLETPKIYI